MTRVGKERDRVPRIEGGWWLPPGRPEIRVAEHHHAVTVAPERFGLTREEIVRIGAHDREAVLGATMQRGFIRVRVFRDESTVHVEMWDLDARSLARVRTWLRRRAPWPGNHRIRIGVLASPRRCLFASVADVAAGG